MKFSRMGNGLGRYYEEHNRRRGSGFIFGGRQRLEALKEFLPEPHGRVLDLGCRDGALAEALGLSSQEVFGVDIDSHALETAAKGHRLIPCVANLWAPLPFRSGTFDLVLAGEVLEHLPFPETMVEEVARVLRFGGTLIGSVPNAFRLKNRVLFLLGRPFEKDPTHLRQFSVGSLTNLLGVHFSTVEIRPCVGRFVTLIPRLTANDLVWCAGGLKRS
jgi:2-polyprenyl-3-methyl-5-hydroxy-6-metoxy-1,4-benzoquinol methylase